MTQFIHFLLYVAVTFISTSLGTQIIKKYFRAITLRKISFKDLTQDGGFPSSHTAFSVSWTVIAIFVTAKLFMINSSYEILLLAMAVSTIAIGNMCVVIRDALGVRRTVQILCDAVKKSAETNNEFFSKVYLIRQDDNEVATKIQRNFEDIAEKMNIRSGHLPHEVIGGACWGIFVASAISSFYFKFYTLMILSIICIVLYIICISIFIKFSNKILSFVMKIIGK